LATWFGCGLVPFAPGTTGALGAIPLYLLAVRGGALTALAVALVVSIAGYWASGVVSRNTGLADAQIIVIDEVAGMLVTLLSLRTPAWLPILVGFVLFRVLDSTKPWPIHLLERLPGAWSIMFDDLAAGAVGAGILGVLQAVGAFS
jgi:phosphatidylglycerophosphatase A